MNIVRRSAAALTGLAALVALSACSTPPWEEAAASASPAPVPSVVVTPTPTPTQTPVKARVKNDLSRGVAKHTLPAGGIEAKATYYSTMPMAQWTAAAPAKPLTLSLTAGFPGGYKQDIFLSDVLVRLDVTGPDGPLASPAPIEDTANVTPGYLVKKPNAYGNVFTVPALPEGAQSVTLTFTYSFIAPKAPKSKAYVKQVASDTVTVAIAGDPSAPTPTPTPTAATATSASPTPTA